MPHLDDKAEIIRLERQLADSAAWAHQVSERINGMAVEHLPDVDPVTVPTLDILAALSAAFKAQQQLLIEVYLWNTDESFGIDLPVEGEPPSWFSFMARLEAAVGHAPEGGAS